MRRQPLDGLAQPYGCPRDAVGEQAIVIGGKRLEASATERAFHAVKIAWLSMIPCTSRIGVAAASTS